MIYDWLLDLTGNAIVAAFLNAVPPLAFIVVFVIFAVLAERKVSAFMQDRMGPMRVGYHGLLQTVADFVKLVQKEDIVNNEADKAMFNLAPFIVFVSSYVVFAAIPFTSTYIGANVDLGILLIVGFSGITVTGLLLAGWSSNNKYSLLGALRSGAQVISYEIPTVLIMLTVVVVVGSLNLLTISEYQTSSFWNWMIFGGVAEGWKKFALIPFMFIGFVVIFISTLAEVNRTPFDIPEAESELVGGYHTEYTGMKFAMFFLAEYANMFAVSAIVAALFLGGFHSPIGYLGNSIGAEWMIPYEQFFWFTVKGLFFIFVQMWLRWSLPRIRVDQLMIVCWKYLIPIALFDFFIVALIMVL